MCVQTRRRSASATGDLALPVALPPVEREPVTPPPLSSAVSAVRSPAFAAPAPGPGGHGSANSVARQLLRTASGIGGRSTASQQSKPD